MASPNPQRRDAADERAVQSRRILDRIGRESESSPLARVRDHIAARDLAPTDPIEVWGTRIGRTIAVTVLTAMILWLIFYVLGG